jgi:hypothetical protein
MSAHPLDRQVRLASVGGTKNGPDKTVTARGHGSQFGISARKRKRLCGQWQLFTCRRSCAGCGALAERHVAGCANTAFPKAATGGRLLDLNFF